MYLYEHVEETCRITFGVEGLAEKRRQLKIKQKRQREHMEKAAAKSEAAAAKRKGASAATAWNGGPKAGGAKRASCLSGNRTHAAMAKRRRLEGGMFGEHGSGGRLVTVRAAGKARPAVGETVILLTSLPLLKRLPKGEGGAADRQSRRRLGTTP